MEQRIRYTLQKENRLKSRKAIEQLFKNGKSINVFPLRIMYLFDSLNNEKEPGGLQAGFTVSTKYFKKAVSRNRIKRLMRESYRLQKNTLEEQLNKTDKQLLLFFIYNNKELPDYKTVYEKMSNAINRLQKIIHENIASNT